MFQALAGPAGQVEKFVVQMDNLEDAIEAVKGTGFAGVVVSYPDMQLAAFVTLESTDPLPYYGVSGGRNMAPFVDQGQPARHLPRPQYPVLYRVTKVQNAAVAK